ncbi:hypothetical protein G6016_15870 [Dietzia aerolata]|uniref:Uncharacterized protein n=1 Tax=Dietzia aerolata TaxID=595984 RepID=A0ABV5JPZ7_9ACTN|nr:hypothetical protein [Dietzia aerolata]MBB0970406.1 hypothetical protein [Dietzia aerolata]
MPCQNASAFALPDHLAHQADSTLIGADDRRFVAISHVLDEKVSVLSPRLDWRGEITRQEETSPDVPPANESARSDRQPTVATFHAE